MRRLLVIVASLLFLVNAGHADPKRDSAAIEILRQTLAHIGWTPAQQPLDSRAIGEISLYDQSGTVVQSGIIEYRGIRNLGIAVQTNYEGDIVTSVFAGGKAVRRADGKEMFLPARQGSTPQLPFFAEFWEYETGQWSVVYLGQETVSGQPAYKIRVWKESHPDNERATEVRKGSEATIWITTTSLLPLQVEYQRGSIENRMAFSTRIRQYSDYRLVQGRLVPFHHEEFAGARKVSSIRFQSISFDVGLNRSEFQIRGGN